MKEVETSGDREKTKAASAEGIKRECGGFNDTVGRYRKVCILDSGRCHVVARGQ